MRNSPKAARAAFGACEPQPSPDPMRLKLLRRRLTISAPRVIVRSHLPWPVRWAAAAVVFGFSAAIALWAFELGKDIAGLERGSAEELTRLRADAQQLRADRDRATALAHTADSLIKAERVAQEQLALQVKQLEAANLVLRADLGFFERLLPAGGEGLAVRAIQVQSHVPGRLSYQLLVMQNRKGAPPFSGRFEFTLAGTLDGKPWATGAPQGAQPLRVAPYARVEGEIEHPPQAVVKTVQVRVLDDSGEVRATQLARL